MDQNQENSTYLGPNRIRTERIREIKDKTRTSKKCSRFVDFWLLQVHDKIPENGVFVFPETSRIFEFGTISEFSTSEKFSMSGDKVLTLASLVLK